MLFRSKQNVVVDNRGGAGGVIGADMAAKSEGDGHTLLFSSDSPITIGPNLYRNAPYDPLRDLLPVGKVVSVVNVLVVNPRQKITSVSELINQAKQRKATPLKFASSGAGAFGHLTGELFKASTGTDITHVPYKGGGPGIAGLIGGETDLSFATYPSVIPHVKSGRLALLAISNIKRSRLLPDVPTIAESGLPGYQFDAWQVLVAPRGTPKAVIGVLNDTLTKALRSTELAQRFRDMGWEATPSTPGEAAAFLQAEHAKWGRVVRERGMRAD